MPSDFAEQIQSDVNLQALNTLAVPAVSRWFCAVATDQQFAQALTFVQRNSCPLLVLGGGSNLLLPEKFEGLVIKVATSGYTVIEESDQDIVVSVAAGERWHQLVLWSVSQGYYGIENLALIPGSVGAAPIQNIGAYGVELDSCFEYLDAIDITTGDLLRLTADECQFGYRDSIFKHRLQDKVIITRVVLRLHKTPRLTLTYPALAQALEGRDPAQLTAHDVARAVIAIRRSKLPDPKKLPNAGSFFKNPVVDEVKHQRLKRSYPELVSYPAANNHFKLAAGWLLEQAGWKGRWVEGIAMHDRQALVLINPESCSARQLLSFADQIRDNIQQQFGVSLEIEPRVVTGR